jgi:hypothetical protein
MFIEAFTMPCDIVLECIAMTDMISSIQFGFWKWFIDKITIRLQLWLDIILCGFFYLRASFCTCLSMDCHILALEEDKEVFFVLLTPLMRLHWLLLHYSLKLSNDLKILVL